MLTARDQDVDRARTHLADCLPIYEPFTDRKAQTTALIDLGLITLFQGQHAESDACLGQALEAVHQIGGGKVETEALIYLSVIYHQRGDDSAARALAEEALPLANEPADLLSKVHALTRPGHALLELGL